MADEAIQSKNEAAASDTNSNNNEEERADSGPDEGPRDDNKNDGNKKASTKQRLDREANKDREAKDRARLSLQPAVAPGAVGVRDGDHTDRESRKLGRQTKQPGAVRASASSSRPSNAKSINRGSVVEQVQSEDPRVARKSARVSAASERSSLSSSGTEPNADDLRVQRKIMRASVAPPSAAASAENSNSENIRVTRNTARSSAASSNNAAPPRPTPFQEAPTPGVRNMSGGSAPYIRGEEQALDRQLPRQLSAELVTNDDVLVSEEEKQRVQREAEAEVQQRFMSAAIVGEATVMPDEEEEESLMANRRRCIILWSAIFLILVIVLSVVLTRGDDDAPLSTPINNICKNAFGPLTNLTGGSIDGVIRPFEETDVVGCQVEADDGFGLWYYLEGNGERIRAATCDTTSLDPQMDTQVLVFAGSCDSLICIGGGDQLCGNHGAVGWMAEEGQRYFVLVRGFRATIGQFSLSVDQLSNHENCQAAHIIETIDSPVFGSTRNHSLDNSFATCDGSKPIAPGSWHRIQGDGAYKCTRASTDDAASVKYAVQLSVYSGGCYDLSCVASSPNSDDPWTGRTDDIVWRADLGADYNLFLNGVESNSTGDFLLEVITTSSNVVCEESVPIDIDGEAHFGTTANSCRVVPVQCPKTIASGDTSGIWYLVRGIGSNLVSASVDFEVETTCVSGRGATAQVSVFASKSNGCDNLECVDFTEFCGSENNATVSQWLADANVKYYLFVQTSKPSDFRLRISETLLEGPDSCATATPIPVGLSVLGSTLNATAGGFTQCGDIASVTTSASVFFMVNGTGRNVTASTCNDGTNYFSGVSILTGRCEALICVEYTSVSCDGVRSLAYWPSVLGETYYVMIYGTEADDPAGRFNLTIEDGGIEVENDFCTTAQSISFPSVVNGTTVGARLDESNQCDVGQSTKQSPGVWYSGKVQDDSLLIASLCNQGTSNFDTVLQVFSGSCESLTCIASNDDHDQVCGRRSLVTWNATAGELYRILVTGFAENDVGEIQLQLSISDDLQLQILD